MDFVDFVVIQGEPGHFAQSGEGSLRQNRDVVLAEVEVLQLSVVAEGQGRHLGQSVVRQHQVLQLCMRQRVGTQRLQIWELTKINGMDLGLKSNAHLNYRS